MKNDILLRRICKLIAMHYAMKEEEVWELYETSGSVDAILVLVAN